MHSVPPRQLLSAYLDGELSPSEREDVERLLSESPDARQELKELEQIRGLLKQLPRETLPKTFAVQVLEACGQNASTETESATRADVPVSSERPKRARWNRWGAALVGVGVSAAALMVMVWLSSPDPQETQQSEIAESSEAHPEYYAPQMAQPDQAMPGEMAPADQESRGPMHAPLIGEQPFPDGSGAGEPAMPLAATPDDPNQESEEQEAAQRARRDYKRVPLEQIVEAVEPAENQVAVVKLSVADRGQGLQDLQQLLQRHKITATDRPASSDRQQGGQALALSATPPSQALMAVYVETNGNQLTAALKELKNQTGFRRLLVEAPIAEAQLGRLVGSSGADLAGGRQSRGMGFNSAGSELPEAESRSIPQQMRSVRPLQAQPARPLQTPEADADSVPAEQPAKDEDKNPNIAPAEKPQQRRSLPVDAAETAPLPAIPQVKKPEKATLQKGFAGSALHADNADEAAGSRQRQVVLPAEVLTALQKQAAQSPAKPSEAETADDAVTDGARRPRNAPQRVQILFVLIEDPAAEEADPADQSSPQNR